MAGKGTSKLWRRLRRIAGVIALVLAVTAAWYLVNRAQSASHAVSVLELPGSEPSEPGAFAGTLKLATFNIAHGRGTNESNFSPAKERRARLEKIAALLKEEKIDIAVLQEVDFDAVWTGHEDQAAFIARAGGFKYVLEQRNFDVAFPLVRLRCGNAILSHHKIVGGTFVPLPVLSLRERRLAGAKQGAFADVELTKGLRIRIFAAHLEWRNEATRVRCAEPILTQSRTSPYPFFCMGDFNSTLPNFPCSELDASGSSLVNLLLGSGVFRTQPENPPVPDQLTWPSYAPAKLIDWIMVPTQWTIVNYRVRATDLSDHRAVFMEVRRPAEP